MDAMQEAGIMGESPSKFETSLRGIAQAMSDLPSLTAEWTRTLNVNAMQTAPAVATSSSSVVIQNFFDEGAFAGAFPSVRTARDAGDFMREINALTERASARGKVPGGV